MFLSFLFTILLLIAFIALWFMENGFLKVVSLLLVIFGSYSCTTNETLHWQRQQWSLDKEVAELKCKHPRLETEIDGVQLYSIVEYCGGDKIYFSKSGTQKKNCKTVHEGKVSRTVCKEMIVPNRGE